MDLIKNVLLNFKSFLNNYYISNLLILLVIILFFNFNAYANSFLDEDDNVVIANDDFGLILLNRAEKINVLINDYGLNSGVSRVKILDSPSHGNVKINDDFSISYNPEKNYEGEDSFEYEVCNNNGVCGTAKVTLDVIYFDYKPSAANDTVKFYWTPEKLVHITKNDKDLLNFPLSLNITSSSEQGRVSTLGDTAIIYSPNRGFYGTDSIAYEICDAENDCAEAWLHIDLLNEDETTLFIPNGFSPNGDGINEVFYVPEFDNVSLINLTIINNWGTIVYKNDNYKNDWNGIGNINSYKGKSLEVGIYYYKFEIPELKKNYTGFIYLNK